MSCLKYGIQLLANMHLHCQKVKMRQPSVYSSQDYWWQAFGATRSWENNFCRRICATISSTLSIRKCSYLVEVTSWSAFRLFITARLEEYFLRGRTGQCPHLLLGYASRPKDSERSRQRTCDLAWRIWVPWEQVVDADFGEGGCHNGQSALSEASGSSPLILQVSISEAIRTPSDAAFVVTWTAHVLAIESETPDDIFDPVGVYLHATIRRNVEFRVHLTQFRV